MQVDMISDLKAEVEKRERTKWENVEPMKTKTSYRWLFVVQLQSRVQLFATTWTAAHQASLSFSVSWNLLTRMSVESVMPSNHLILCRPLLLPSIFPSIKGLFSLSGLFASG